MKSQTVSSTGTSRSYRASAGGEPPKGPPTSPVKPIDIDDFDFSGEPQGLSGDSNLSTFCEREDTSRTNSKSDPSQQQFGSRSSVDDGSREADAASEESESVPPPARTPLGPAQSSVQLSDDPTIAALQKSTLAVTTQVVLYAQCLAILDNALADPQCKLPPNSFSYLRGLFGGAIKECEGRAQGLTTETEQLLAQHTRQAQSLAVQAGGSAPGNNGNGTFSTGKSDVTTEDLDKLLDEMKQLPQPQQRRAVAKGVLRALDNQSARDDKIEKIWNSLLRDIEYPDMARVDSEVVDFYLQNQRNLEEDWISELNNNGLTGKQTGQNEQSDEIDQLIGGQELAQTATWAGDNLDDIDFRYLDNYHPTDIDGTTATSERSDEIDQLVGEQELAQKITRNNDDLDDIDLDNLDDYQPAATNATSDSKESSSKTDALTLNDAKRQAELAAEQEADEILREFALEATPDVHTGTSIRTDMEGVPGPTLDDELDSLTHLAVRPRTLEINDWFQINQEVIRIKNSITDQANGPLSGSDNALRMRYMRWGGTEIKFRTDLQEQRRKEAIAEQSRIIDGASNELKDIVNGRATSDQTLDAKKNRVNELNKQIAMTAHVRSAIKHLEFDSPTATKHLKNK